jgi:medium-chain acyl-[acyl-carrier-protein] hydrolase
MLNFMSKSAIPIFCFPFAGGNSYSYRKFEPALPAGLKLVPVELPGHGRRMKLPLLKEMHAMATDLAGQMQAQIQTPYALYGHSLGALLAHLTTLKLRAARCPLPCHLFVSGCHSPTAPVRNDRIHLLPQTAFIDKVVSYGGLPPEVAADQELMALFTPILRADFQALMEYQYLPTAPLNLPITVLLGTDDSVSLAEGQRWQEVTTGPVTVKQFVGNHFFIFDYITDILTTFAAALGRVQAF